MRLKKSLILGGLIAVIVGMIMLLWPAPEEKKELWEKIPDEEIHTNIEEAKQTEDIPVNEEHSSSEEGASEVGSDSGAECEGDEEEPGAIIDISYKEAALLKRLAMAEAGGEGIKGQWLVMSVVLNRVADPEWPDSITDVIYQYGVTKDGRKIYQFSCVSDGRIDGIEVSGDSGAALAKIEAGDVAEDIVAFEVTSSNVLDTWFKYSYTYKHHKFYTKSDEKRIER